MEMFAFYKTSHDFLIKVFDKRDDWQVLAGSCEGWYSQWSFDKQASLEAALEKFLDYHLDEEFSKDRLVLVA